MALNVGSKVKYRDAEGKLRKGVVHGIRKVDIHPGRPEVLSYMIDTGEENPDHIGRPDRQPELIDVRPSDVQPRLI